MELAPLTTDQQQQDQRQKADIPMLFDITAIFAITPEAWGNWCKS